MKEKDYFSLADTYLDGEIKGDELIDFENELKTNPTLVEEVKLHEEINKFIALYLFRKSIIVAEKNYFEGQKKYNKKIFRFIKNPFVIVAASIVIILSSSLFIFQINQNDSKDLFNKYYTRVETFGLTRGIEEEKEEYIEKLIHDGVYHYALHRNYSAMKYFEKALQLDSNKIGAVYFYAGALMEVHQYEKAEKLLLKVSKCECILAENAFWYLSLCYLKLNKQEKSKVILKNISANKGNYHSTKASELLNQLNNLKKAK